MTNINTAWFRGVNMSDPEAKQRRVDLVTNGLTLLEVLGTVLVSEIAELDKTSVEDYDTPNWALREADRKGQMRSLRKMLAMTQRTPK